MDTKAIWWGVFDEAEAVHVAPVDAEGKTEHWLSTACPCAPDVTQYFRPLAVHHLEQ